MTAALRHEARLRWLRDAWAVPAERRELEVEGAAVSYRDWGRDDGVADTDGLVFVHGFLAHARWWDHIAPHFRSRHHVIATDLTGMGDSGWRPAYDRRQYARETIAALRHAGIRRATIVAHSFGSLSSLYAALLAPDLIERVIVIDGFVFRAEPGSIPDAIMPEKRYATREEALGRYRLRPPGLWPVPEIVAHVADHSLREVEGEWGWKFDPRTFASVNSDDLRDELCGQPIRAEYIRAGNSETIGEAEVAQFRASLPLCGEPVTIPLSHHHVMLEEPESLVATLEGLLARPCGPACAAMPEPILADS